MYPFCAFELAVASCTPLVPFVAKLPSRISGRAQGHRPYTLLAFELAVALYPFCAFELAVARCTARAFELSVALYPFCAFCG